MPTSGYSFADTEISVRFRAPYITSAINQQFRGIVSVGIYEGFNPSPSVNPLGLDLNVGSSGRSSAVIASLLDPTSHVAVHLDNVLEVDLTSFASKTVALAIDASYAFPSETTATVNIYDLSTETVPTTACTLAEVVVPASGLIPAANITLNNRTFPWETRGRDATPLISAIRNGEPLLVPSATGMPDFWAQEGSASQVVFDGSDAETAPSGFDLSFRARKVATGTSAVSGQLVQHIGLPIPANRRVRLSAAYWPVVAPASGNPTILAVISDFAGVLVTTVELDLTSTSLGSWESYAEFSSLPAVGTAPVILKEVRVILDNVTYTTAGALSPLFYLAAIDVQVEQSGSATDVLASMSGEKHATKLRVYEGAYPGAANVGLTFTQTSPGVYETALDPTIFPPSHTFRVGGKAQIDQDLTVLGSANIGLVFVNSLDTAVPPPALELNVGPTNATGVNISKAGAQTRVKGTLRVDQALTVDGSLDVIAAGPMTIGATATEIHVAAPGINTIVEGNIIVKGTTFSSETETVLISDSHLYLNNGWTPASAKKGGLVVNYLPTATTDTTASSYTATTVDTVGSATFATGDVIQISGSDKNAGLYVVASHVGTTLTIDTSAPVSDQWYQTAFTVAPSEAAVITKVNVSLLRSGTTGAWEVSYGSTLADVTANSKPVATSGGGGGGGSGEVAFFSGGSLTSDSAMSYGKTSLNPTLTLTGSSSAELLLNNTGGTRPVSLKQTELGGTTFFNVNVDSTQTLSLRATDATLGTSYRSGTFAIGAEPLGLFDVLSISFGDPSGVYLSASRSPFAGGSAPQFHLSADSIRFDSSALLQRALIDSNGNFIVGSTTSNPDTAKLHVSGGSITHTSSQFNVRPGASVNYEWVNRSTFGGHTWYVHAGSVQAMTITGSGSDVGKVGIGEVLPSTLLDLFESDIGERAVLRIRASDTGVSNQISFRNGSNSSFGVIGTVSGTGTAGNDVFGLGHALNPVITDFTSVFNWRSNGTVGINVSPVTGVPLRVQEVGSNDIGLDMVRVSASSMALLSYNRGTSSYGDLLLDGSNVVLRPNGNTSAVAKSGGVLVVGGDDGVTSAGILRAPNRTGTNLAGNQLVITSGASTGTQNGGNIVFRVTGNGSSGSTQNPFVDKLTIGSFSATFADDTFFNQNVEVMSVLTVDDRIETAEISDRGAGLSLGGTTVSIVGTSASTSAVRLRASNAAGGIEGEASAVTFYGSTASAWAGNFGTQAHAAGIGKTINIGTGSGAATSSTTITLGSAANNTNILLQGSTLGIVGRSDANSTVNIASQANTAGISKTVNIGNSANGGTTQVNILTSVTSGTSNIDIGTNTTDVEMRGNAFDFTSDTATSVTVNWLNQQNSGTNTFNIGNCSGGQTGSTDVSIATSARTANVNVGSAILVQRVSRNAGNNLVRIVKFTEGIYSFSAISGFTAAEEIGPRLYLPSGLYRFRVYCAYNNSATLDSNIELAIRSNVAGHISRASYIAFGSDNPSPSTCVFNAGVQQTDFFAGPMCTGTEKEAVLLDGTISVGSNDTAYISLYAQSGTANPVVVPVGSYFEIFAIN